jgi:hypothetical protein
MKIKSRYNEKDLVEVDIDGLIINYLDKGTCFLADWLLVDCLAAIMKIYSSQHYLFALNYSRALFNFLEYFLFGTIRIQFAKLFAYFKRQTICLINDNCYFFR